jgi:phenylpyruvate tautomerase PptA (4-oxalocrotonate tautomerase family)
MSWRSWMKSVSWIEIVMGGKPKTEGSRWGARTVTMMTKTLLLLMVSANDVIVDSVCERMWAWGGESYFADRQTWQQSSAHIYATEEKGLVGRCKHAEA